MTSQELDKAGWELANDCLDILPADNLALTGLTLIHLVAVWLNAVPEEARPVSYVQWLDMLHNHLDRAKVLEVKSVVGLFDEGSGGSGSEAMH